MHQLTAHRTRGRISTGRHVTRIAVVAVLLTAVGGLAAGPVSARPDPGPSDAPEHSGSAQCPLTRVGTEYIRCDDNTGNGVPAPGWVPER